MRYELRMETALLHAHFAFRSACAEMNEVKLWLRQTVSLPKTLCTRVGMRMTARRVGSARELLWLVSATIALHPAACARPRTLAFMMSESVS